jgi:phosphoglycolate phosphatase
MRLSELCSYDKIYIQTHDKPDADSIASGFGLYTFFKSRGKDTTLFYSGRNKIAKSNLTLMVKKLNIPLKYMEPSEQKLPGLLITVDCQWGAGNVTKFEAEDVAIIDHHQMEITDVEKTLIHSNLGACSTLVWTKLQEEQFPINDNANL